MTQRIQLYRVDVINCEHDRERAKYFYREAAALRLCDETRKKRRAKYAADIEKIVFRIDAYLTENDIARLCALLEEEAEAYS